MSLPNPSRLGLGRFDQRRVRRVNLAEVLGHVADHGPLSRATLASATGLNKTTVSSLVAELIDWGMLIETGDEERPGAIGRPAQTLRLAGDAIAAIGIEVDFDHVALAALDLTGTVRRTDERMLDPRASGPEQTVALMAELAHDALAELAADGLEVVEVSVAADGIVDSTRGIVVSAPDLEWSMIPLAEMLHGALGEAATPVHVDNDANLGALAELWTGAGRGRRDFVYVSGSFGVGAGIVARGELFRGAHGFGGEFGHLPIERDGRPCTCGARGCVAAYAGMDVLFEHAGLKDAGGVPRRERTRRIAERARGGDAGTLHGIAEVGRALGVGLSGLANVLDPEAIVLGGSFAPLHEWLRAPVEAELEARRIARRWARCDVIPSPLLEEASTAGAALRGLRDVLADPAAYAPRRGAEPAEEDATPPWRRDAAGRPRPRRIP